MTSRDPKNPSAPPVDFLGDDDLAALRPSDVDVKVEATTVMPTSAKEASPDFKADLERAARLGVSMATMLIEPLPAGRSAQLAFIDGQWPAATIHKSVTVLGRSEAADVVVPNDGQVSREHAAILYSQGEFFIEDLESSNGTFVNDKRVKRAKLSFGDLVRIGSFTLKLGPRR